MTSFYNNIGIPTNNVHYDFLYICVYTEMPIPRMIFPHAGLHPLDSGSFNLQSFGDCSLFVLWWISVGSAAFNRKHTLLAPMRFLDFTV